MTQTAPAPTDVAAVPLEALTDEELAVLAGPGGIVVSPFLDLIGDDQRATALRTAYRGLLARGIVDPPLPEAVTDSASGGDPQPPVALSVRADVHSLVALRGAARAVVAVARYTSDGQDFWYAHLVEEVALLEEVGVDGIHRFALLPPEALAAAVVEAVVHPDTGDANGEPLPIESTRDADGADAVLAQLGAAFVRCDLVVRKAGDERPIMLGVFTGPRGAWVVRSTYGAVGSVRAEPRTAEAVRAEVSAAVTPLLTVDERSDSDG